MVQDDSLQSGTIGYIISKDWILFWQIHLVYSWTSKHLMSLLEVIIVLWVSVWDNLPNNTYMFAVKLLVCRMHKRNNLNAMT